VSAPVFYTGVGNRNAPASALALCREVGAELAARGLTLRTGDASGADAAFRDGATSVDAPGEVMTYSPDDDLPPWAFDLARSLVGPSEWLTRSAQVRRLFARSMLQVLGPDGRDPSRFLLCWTRWRDSRAASAGGTRLAVRCADDGDARRDAGVSDASVPWLNLNGLTVADALAFAHEHAGVPVLQPGDLLPRRCVPDGSFVRSTGSQFTVWTVRLDGCMRVARTPHGKTPGAWRGWDDFPHTPTPWEGGHDPEETPVELVALGLSRETATAEHLRALAKEHDARKVRE
jgi:hypothetical protein